MSSEHIFFIQKSLQLAQQAMNNGNHPFGALLVKDSEVLLTAENSVNTDHDPSRHAELNLVQQASLQFSSEILSQCILYTSTEPCAMCAGAIYWVGIPWVVYSCSAEALGDITGGDFVIPCREIFARGKRPVQVTGPILEQESIEIHRQYWH